MKTAWALITGASGGIGLDLAHLCASHGINLILASRDGRKLEAAAEALRKKGVEARVIVSDLSVPGAAARLHSEVSGLGVDLEILINNAGVGNSGPLLQGDPQKLAAMLQLNVVSLAELTRLCAADFVKRGSGKILNVASTAAFQPIPYFSAYSASKSFVLSFSEAVGEELRGSGVTVTCLAPGPTATGFAEAAQMVGSRIFAKGSTSTSHDVARGGFEAMMAGRRLVVIGLKNRALSVASRLLPRGGMLKVMRQIMAGDA